MPKYQIGFWNEMYKNDTDGVISENSNLLQNIFCIFLYSPTVRRHEKDSVKWESQYLFDTPMYLIILIVTLSTKLSWIECPFPVDNHKVYYSKLALLQIKGNNGIR